MLQLKNSTPFAAKMTFFPNEFGVDTLYIMVKATFTIGSKWILLEEQPPVQEEDVYWTEPVKSSIRYPSDIHIAKPATDIIMIGHAHVPNSKQTTALDVNLTVGKKNKTIRVIGDRIWKNAQITAPTPFTSMSMVYEKAYGGSYISDRKIHSVESRNPVGCGFAGARKAHEMDNVPLPNLEDPANLISSHMDQPAPSNFGCSAPAWQPRASYAGTYDEHWQQTLAPYLPIDFDTRFFNMAHPDMIVNGYLTGGEPVHISNMHINGDLDFKLPQLKLVTHVKIENRVESAHFNMETLLLEPNQQQLSMVWKATIPCDKKALRIDEVAITLSR